MPTRILLLTAITMLHGAHWAACQNKKSLNVLQETWNLVTTEEDGLKEPRRKKGDDWRVLVFQDAKFELKRADKIVKSGTYKIDSGKKPMTIDLDVREGDGKGTVQLGIFDIKGDTLQICLDLSGKGQPTDFRSSERLLMVLQRERKAGIDPTDASVVYDQPWQMGSGFKAYNGKVYDKVSLCIEPKVKLILPTAATTMERHDKANELLVFMEKRAGIHAHFVRASSVLDYRERMGCAVKLDKKQLFIGTFGEFGFLEGSIGMRLHIVAPKNVEVERRDGLSGGYGGRSGSERPASAINPARDEPTPALAQKKAGTSCWLAPTAEDGWHAIPTDPDPDRRAAKATGN